MDFIGGDSRYFWPGTFRGLAQLPSAWDSSLNTGIGDPAVGSLWIVSYLNFTAWIGNAFGLSWGVTSLLFWILPALLLSFFSAYFLFQYLFSSNKKFSIIAAIIYGSNSYIQMVFLGGQIGVALSYAFLPAVIIGLLKAFERPGLRRGIVAGFLLSLQVLFDPRFALMSVGVSLLYWLFVQRKNTRKQLVFGVVVPLLLTILLHFYWLLPLVLFKFPSLPAGFSSQEGFAFFSFGDFSHSMSLLHPNWPENIFGKVSFLRFQFLTLPIVAFSSLLFLKTKDVSKKVLFFSVLAIISIFLSKGSKEPFAGISNLLFQQVPFMSLFRDSTKFYALIALSYAMLAPYALANFFDVYKKYIKIRTVRITEYIFIGFFFFGWLLLHTPIITEGHVQFNTTVPNEYKTLQILLENDTDFYRTLWIPQWQRYGYFSDLHPAIGRNEIFKTTDPLKMARELEKKKNVLERFQVKYVIIPYDSKGEMFLNDRSYSGLIRKKTEDIVDTIPWLVKKDIVSGISIYELPGKKMRFWMNNGTEIISKMRSPTHYLVMHKAAKNQTDLLFSEAFDKHWVARTVKGRGIAATNAHGIISFPLRENEAISDVYFYPQRVVVLGLLISLITFVVAVVIVLRGGSSSGSSK